MTKAGSAIGLSILLISAGTWTQVCAFQVAAPVSSLKTSPVISGSWSKEPPMPLSLGEVAGGVIDGIMYLVGEKSNATLSYRISTREWRVAGLAQRPYVGNHHGAEVYAGKLYLIGGLGSGAGIVQIYDPAKNSWTLGAPVPYAGGSVSTALIGQDIYVAGGIVGRGTVTNAARYDLVRNRWYSLPQLPVGVNHTASATDGSRFYIFGGRAGANTPSIGFDTVQVFDPISMNWRTSGGRRSPRIASLPQARGGMGKAVYYKGEFYIIGGETKGGIGATPNQVYNRVDVYNEAANSWRLDPPLPTARHGIFPLLFEDKILVAGGGVHSGNSQSGFLEMFTITRN